MSAPTTKTTNLPEALQHAIDLIMESDVLEEVAEESAAAIRNAHAAYVALEAECDELRISLAESMQISRDTQNRLTAAQKERDEALGIAELRLESMTRQAATLEQLTADCTELRARLESQALQHRQFEQMHLRFMEAVAAGVAMQPPRIYLHVGESQFESWLSEHPRSADTIKQHCRDSYAAGMSDQGEAR